MSVILILLIASLGLALVFLGGFIWAARSGQFDDTCTPALRVLTDEEKQSPNREKRAACGTATTARVDSIST